MNEFLVMLVYIVVRIFSMKYILNTQINLKHFKFTYFTVQAHMATKMCVHTLSLSVESTQSLLPSGCPVAQSAQGLPNLPTAKDCPGPYRPKLLHRDSGFNSLGANTGTHILLSWHSLRMPHSITTFAWSI